MQLVMTDGSHAIHNRNSEQIVSRCFFLYNAFSYITHMQIYELTWKYQHRKKEMKWGHATRIIA